MVNMQNLPTSLLLLVSSILFATSSSALHIRARLDVYPTPIAELSNVVAAPIITPAPTLDSLGDLKFARQAIPSIPACATSCIASAVTKSTNCKLGDYKCECNSATIINRGAAPCVQSACGYIVALQAQAAGEELCISVLAGLIPGSTPEPSPTNTNNNGPDPSKSSASGGGSPKSTGSSSGGSGGSSGGGSGSGSGSLGSLGSPRPSKKSKLSGGAIAGIVVGVVAGLAAAAGVIWKFCLNKMKGGSDAAAAGVNGTTTDAAAASGAAVQTAHVPPVDPLKPAGLTSTTPLSTPSELSNNVPQTVSSVSPYQSPVTPTPPVYPNAAELPNGQWPQQQPPAGYAYPPQPMGGYAVPGQQQYVPGQPYPQMQQAYHEAPGAPPPEMAGDTHIVQELHGQPAGGAVYEMGH
ncbi:hypothetical protein TARUN_3675 [Trichoderma arundinaceum]|uniref:CFEM domain-containing protein n=1 Tax=Trichoderma arundinaceum TaxID=490622 RepID=A0A395NRE2_TRIAR|nr:hypothetical protein TARUN_3675 [Trichoderma arundinaceum]